MQLQEEVVLIVDDEEGIRETLRRALQRARPRARILVAANGEQALQVLRRERVDVIVSDHRMPGMAGLELLQRAYEIDPSIPRVLMTAYPEMPLLVRGANDVHLAHFLAKPFRLDAAMRTIGALLDERCMQLARETALERSRAIATARLTAASGRPEGAPPGPPASPGSS